MRWWGRWASREADRGEAEDALRRSLFAALDDDIEAAESWLARAVQADSEDVDAYLMLAALYRKRGEIGRAIRMHQNLLLRRDLGEEPRVVCLFELGRDFAAGGFLQRAMASFDEVLSYSPRHAGALEAELEVAGDLRQWERARALLARLAKVNRRRAEALEVGIHLREAQAHYEAGAPDAARKSLRKVLRQAPQDARAHVLLGLLAAERGKTKQALEAWKKAVLSDEKRAIDVYPKLESCYAALDRARDFESFLNEVIERRPKDLGARVALARHLAARGEAGPAAEVLRRAIEQAPGALSAHAALGRILLSEGHDAEALKAYAGLLEALDDEPRAARESAGSDAGAAKEDAS